MNGRVVPLVTAAFSLIATRAWAEEPAAPPVEPPKPPAQSAMRATHALTIELTPGWTRQLLPAVPHGPETSHTNGGPSVVLGITYRSPYFLAPFLEGSWFPLYADEQTKLVPGYGVLHLDASLTAAAVMGGVSFSFWRLRARAGVGTYLLHVSSHVLGDTLSTSELDMGYLLALEGWLWQGERLRVGVSLRTDFIVQAGTTFETLGVTLGGDAISW